MYPVPKEDDPWAIRPAEPVQTMEEAVEMVKSVLGGTTTFGYTALPWWRNELENWNYEAGKQWGHWRCMNHILEMAKQNAVIQSGMRLSQMVHGVSHR
jgi:hypothetical protein